MAPKKSQQTEPRVFEELVSAYLDALYRTSVRFCGGNRADAEDLLQDAMLRAFEHFTELREPEAARAWLFMILVRTNLNRYRTRQRRAETLVSDLDERAFEAALASWRNVPAAEELFNQLVTRDDIAAALEALDEPLRVVVWLSDVEGFRQREVAEMLELPEGTVASRLFRARGVLRDLLAQHAPAARAGRIR